MLVFSVLVFALATFVLSFLIGRESDFDRGKVAAYVTLVAWGSLIVGWCIGGAAR